MALQRLTIKGFGQIEPNNVTFTRDGRVEAQYPLANAEMVAENGMLLVVDDATRTVTFPTEGETRPVALHYSTEKLYNGTGLREFKLTQKDGFLPRMGYLTVGEVFTTNCVCYDTTEFADDAALKEAAGKVKETVLYGGISVNGAIKVSGTKPTTGPVLVASKATTMPDGQFAIEFKVQ